MQRYLLRSIKGIAVATVLLTACIVAVIDGVAAVILTMSYGGRPARVFQYIASSVLGSDAFSGGSSTTALGILLHFAVAFVWTSFFFIVHATLHRYIPQFYVRALLYGLFIWLVMNLAVLPLTQVVQRPIEFTSAATGIAILIAAAGVPIVYQFDRFQRKQKI